MFSLLGVGLLFLALALIILESANRELLADIVQRRETEAALRDSEEKFRHQGVGTEGRGDRQGPADPGAPWRGHAGSGQPGQRYWRIPGQPRA